MSQETVVEHIKTIIANIHQNRTNIQNQLAQGEQQISVLKFQYESAGTLIAVLEHALEQGVEAIEAILKRVFANSEAAAQVASSPPQPATAGADAAVAGAPQS